MSERLGVFGGTFDPPHVGHLVTAVNVCHHLRLDRVLFVVANVPWQKVGTRAVTHAEHRYAMVERAVAGVDRLEASRIEIDRGGDSLTADTLVELHDTDPDRDLFLLVGSDAAAGLATWRHTETLRRLATLALVARPGAEHGRPPAGWRFTVVDSPLVDVSSTEVRQRLRDGRPLDFLVPDPVLTYIAEHALYR